MFRLTQNKTKKHVVTATNLSACLSWIILFLPEETDLSCVRTGNNYKNDLIRFIFLTSKIQVPKGMK